ncbi:hypothetical protein AJ78_06595 [Emergomyces pasteurianus Ep9510]|uniref:DUF7924 domain-containing protein n=1 Tax=Emergomyces pasteurianus Ep9510 TaxID=1447872 RepID=A0A1J9P8S3_9EURO|nr:hypothetical protein AJ78_06595 [Emergomyces pasteurianus Ep9510]
MIVQDISSLVCPSAQLLRIYDMKHLKLLNESVNESWNSAISFYEPRPQPDYSVGFGRSAFTDDQLEKLKPFVDKVTDAFTFYFMIIWQMYFSFLICEVKCGAAALDVADRQNAHSMTLAVRSVTDLFRLANRENELHREILAFSISHDHRTVRIYGHYSIIKEEETSFYRYSIRTFDFTELNGKEKWAAYKICSVIDDLPLDLHFEVLLQSELGESGLSQRLESHHLADQTSHDIASLNEADSQSSHVGSRDETSDTSLSQRIDGKAFRKAKKRAWIIELHRFQDAV